MADERDAKLSRQYRSLEPLEPPAGLDDGILSAARRAARRRHSPRWYYSLAAAAVLVLAVALTVQLERPPSDAEAPNQVSRGSVKQAPAPEPAPAPGPAPARAEQTKPAAPAPRPVQPARESPPASVARQEARAMADAAAPAAAARAAPEKPERWLERIAEMRSRGRHEEADRQLAEFRRAYPNYPLSEIMRERVEGR